MSNQYGQGYGQGVPYGIPRFPPPSAGGRYGSDDDYGGMSRPNGQRQGQPPNPRSVLRKNGSNNAGRLPSRPPQSPQSPQQWPLSSGSAQSTYRGPPQRPPRPADNSVFGQAKPSSDRLQHNDRLAPQYAGSAPQTSSSAYSGPGIWSEDGQDSSSLYPSPNPSRPTTNASAASVSSAYSRPDMPPPLPSALPPIPDNALARAPPQQPKSPRDRAPLGPPPSARRGPSSYYSQPTHLSHVTPIVEESDRDSSFRSLRNGDESRGSYASSNAIPIGVPDYYLNDVSHPSHGRPNIDSYASEYDDYDLTPPPPVAVQGGTASPPGLVRQASIGKRSKPTLTTIKCNEDMDEGPTEHDDYSDDSDDDDDDDDDDLRHVQAVRRPPFGIAHSGNSRDPDALRRAQSDLTGSSGPLGRSDTSFFDRASSDSEKSDYMHSNKEDYFGGPTSGRIPRPPPENAADPRVESILNRLEKGGAIPHNQDKSTHLDQPSTLAQRVGTKRPPRLDVDAVRDAEKRGSLTSLPDLIRRATKLASNLDRGKTASRLGFDWMIGDDKAGGKAGNRRSSLTDMISAFPPPALGTPRSDTPGRFGWPSNLRNSGEHSYSTDGKGDDRGSRPKKRVCGMPKWAFLLLLLVLILLIAAAVIVPVVLVVIPRQNETPAQKLQACKAKLTCNNAGVNVLGFDGTCRCLCVDGFSGSSCTTGFEASCTGIDVPGASNATVGDSIPRLLDDATKNFSVPLDSSQILSAFAASDLSCSSENSLVTFTGFENKTQDTVADSRLAGDILAPMVTPAPSRTFPRRQETTLTQQTATTSNGIVFALGAPPGATATNSPNQTTPGELDFARVAVLYILQDSGQLDEALAAQSNFQKWFGGQAAPGIPSTNITLQNGYSANLNSGQLVVKNGTKVGRRP